CAGWNHGSFDIW
nr:immunoglobulin heavy chain junction region [Macaca mulatta]